MRRIYLFLLSFLLTLLSNNKSIVVLMYLLNSIYIYISYIYIFYGSNEGMREVCQCWVLIQKKCVHVVLTFFRVCSGNSLTTSLDNE